MCNQRCPFCHAKGTNNITIEDVKKILDNLKILQIKDIILTGGEPFLRKDIFEIMDMIQRGGYCVDLCTNGTLLDKEKISNLKKYVSEISVSLDAHNRELYRVLRGRDDFDKVIQNIRELVFQGIAVHLICTLNSHNYPFVEQIIALAEELRVDSIAVANIIADIANDVDYVKSVLLTDAQCKDIMLLIERLRPVTGIIINTKNIRKVCDNKQCMAGKNILGITSDGYLISCIMRRNSRKIKITGKIDAQMLHDLTADYMESFQK
jgi:MoaA/NifB/PqqE/SkfB family radical SAM enzyme